MVRTPLFFLILLLGAGSVSCQKKAYTFKIYHVIPYCGGAKPSPELEAEHRKAKPYAGKLIYFVSDKGTVDSAVTDQHGTAKIKLPTGTFKVYEEWRYKKRTFNGAAPEGFDAACLANEWKKAFLWVSIGKRKVVQKQDDELVAYCDWNPPCQNNTQPPPSRPQ